MQTIKQVDKRWLMGIPTPERTDSYSPVNHIQLLDFTEKKIKDTGLDIKRSNIVSTNNGNKIIATYDLGSSDPDLGNRIVVRNSYDKSVTLLIANGLEVYLCSNGMLMNADSQYRRKHTGEVWMEIMSQFNGVIENIDKELKLAIEAKMILNQAPLINPIDQVSNILGHMFYKEEIINSVQLNIMKEQLNNSKNFKHIDDSRFTLWDMYNAGTEALKRSHPDNYIEDHVNLHEFMMNQAGEAIYV